MSRRQAQVSMEGDRGIIAERIFDAPRARVWRAYTQPDQLALWWGRGNHLDIVRCEVQHGGRWRFVEHSEEGIDGFEGKFREIVPEERISQTFEWDGMPGYVSLSVAEFLDGEDDTTKVTTTSLFFTSGERDNMLELGMLEGMEQSFRALDALLAEADATAAEG